MTQAIYRSKESGSAESSEANNSQHNKRRRVWLALVLLTCTVYGAFLVHKFMQIAATPESTADIPLSEAKLQQTFGNEGALLPNDAYLQAAELADEELLDKVRDKYKPEDLQLQNPRAYWHQRVTALEAELETMKENKLYESTFGEREQQRLKNIKEDKPTL